MAYSNIREEELKNKVAADFFGNYDCTKIIGNVDFCVSLRTTRKQNQIFETESLLWAEAKKGKSDIIESITQLILTIGKARTFDKFLPPAYLGAFDAEKIAFIPYNEIHDIFYVNDFNWNVTSSNHNTKEFKQVLQKVSGILNNNSLLFKFDKDDHEINEFIKKNFIVGKSDVSKIKIDKNNFTIIYNKWLVNVKDTIAVNWKAAQKSGIFDCDFYLADLLSHENETLKEKLFVLLKKDHYELDRQINESGLFTHSETTFKDKQKAHKEFWNKYERPPKKEYWDYIAERRDLLVPQDVRERKGSYFTPQKWVEISQQYLADLLGDNWQDEYYIWDCASGTGNLLTGLTNKYNIFASTLDKADVEVIHDRIDSMNENSPKKDGANLLHDHVFKFDFLNDEFTKLPKALQDIINSEKKRKKLVIYINPPYAEGDNVKGEGRKNVQVSRIHDKYAHEMRKASGELFAQFFMRIYREIPGCILAEFSKLKMLQSPNFTDFRNVFQPKLEKLFIVPADTFDNVDGKFPIGFFIWNCNKTERFNGTSADVYDAKGNYAGQKGIYSYDETKYISDWLEDHSKASAKKKASEYIGHLASVGNDFQNQRMIFIDHPNEKRKKGGRHTMISADNLIVASMYYAIRHCIPATWLNDRDQFLYPQDGWQTDYEFQNDCLAYTIFNNNVHSDAGTNHWIPFTEKEVNAQGKFESSFMTDFIKGKIKTKSYGDLFDTKPKKSGALEFSTEAVELFLAGRELWRYFHSIKHANVNASFYDIREYFQGRNAAGKMNNTSNDEKYTTLVKDVRRLLGVLEDKIATKVYTYGFLKGD